MLYPLSEYEEKKRKQLLNRAIWITVISSLLFGMFNIDLQSWASVAVIFFSTILCMLALWVNNKGHAKPASLLVCGSVLMAITYSIYDGDGLLDPGIIGYASFILLGTLLLLDKRFTPWLTLAAILSLAFIGYMQANGFLHLTIRMNDASNVVPIAIFLVASALIVYVILDHLQNNYRRIQESETELRRSYDLTIQGLSKAIGMRDVDTGGHSTRVVEMTEQLARALGYPEKEMLSLRYGAYMHDIGKIGIPDSILNKPGPLDPDEMAVMRTHTLLAEEILLPIPYLQPALAIPKYHHEHWDGNGYPERIKGEQIPLAARIFAVVDVWDALTHDRPYRLAWAGEKAKAYIMERAGTQFDPRVVEAFEKISQ
jgi:HD-GYP domain-containing protein (c-di-GMP phosphodiesterase class II)